MCLQAPQFSQQLPRFFSNPLFVAERLIGTSFETQGTAKLPLFGVACEAQRRLSKLRSFQ